MKTKDRVHRMPQRFSLAIVVCALFLFALPGAASASHIMGGSLELQVSDDRISGTLVYSERGDCTVGDPAFDLDVEITDPNLDTDFVNVVTTYVRCIPGQVTIAGSFDVDIDDDLGLAVVDGLYQGAFTTCCRVSGIVNGDPLDDSTSFRAQVTRNGSAPNSSPTFGSLPVTGIAVGSPYLQNLNAFSPIGSALTYTSQAGQPTAPAYDVASFEPDGDVFIPAATTATFSDGEFYVYKVRVTDATGNFAERDVLLFVTDQNTPPVFHGLPSGPVEVEPGETEIIPFTVDDAELAQTVSVFANGLPSWASFATTPGNPAEGTLTLSPPAGTADGTSKTISLDALDDFADVPLSASAAVTAVVRAAAPPKGFQVDLNDDTPVFAGDGTIPVTCRAVGITRCRISALVHTRKPSQPTVVVAGQRKRRAHVIAEGESLGNGQELTVMVGFSKFGRKLIRKRIGGRRITFTVEAVVDGEAVNDSFQARVLPSQNTIFTRGGDFRDSGASLSGKGLARIGRIAQGLHHSYVSKITCGLYSEQKDRSRAESVCAELRERLGSEIEYRVTVKRSRGDRVGITVLYR
jgi:hypothetical protein